MLVKALEYVKRRRPKVGVMENVLGMEMVRHGDDSSALSYIQQQLEAIGLFTDHLHIDLHLFNAAHRHGPLREGIALRCRCTDSVADKRPTNLLFPQSPLPRKANAWSVCLLSHQL